MFQSIPEVQRQIDLLRRFFDGRSDGEMVTWLEIERECSIPMRAQSKGRQLVRRALKLSKRPYEAVFGEGIRLSAPETALTIAHGKIHRIDGAVRVASRTQKHLQERHLEQMQEEDRKKLLTLAGFFGAVRALSKRF